MGCNDLLRFPLSAHATPKSILINYVIGNLLSFIAVVLSAC